MPTNLFEYYKSIGQSLPSLSQRSLTYQQYGLGSATTYAGTAEQNTTLLQKLLSGAAQPAGTTQQLQGGATTPQLQGGVITPQIQPAQTAQTIQPAQTAQAVQPTQPTATLSGRFTYVWNGNRYVDGKNLGPDTPELKTQVSGISSLGNLTGSEQDIKTYLTSKGITLGTESVSIPSQPPQPTAQPQIQQPTPSSQTPIQSPAQPQQPQAAQQSIDSYIRSLIQSMIPTAQAAGTQPTTQPITQPQGQGQPQQAEPSIGSFVSIGGAFFQQSPQGLMAVSEPATLRGLQGGQIPFITQASFSGGAGRFAPTSAPLNQPGTQQPQEPQIDAATQSFVKDFGLPSPERLENPISWFTKAYEKFYKDLGIASVKDRIKELSKGVEDINNKLADEIADVNDNPWISEGLRTKKIANLQEKYQARQNNAVKRLQLEQSIYDDVRQEAQFFLGKQFGFQADLMLKYMDYAEKRASAAEKVEDTDDLREYRVAKKEGFTGGFLEFLKLTKAGRGLTPGQIKMTLRTNAITKARPVLEGSKGQDGYVDPRIYQKLRLDYAEIIGDITEFDETFSSMLSPQNRANLGIGKSVGIKAEETTQASGGFWAWLSNQF